MQLPGGGWYLLAGGGWGGWSFGIQTRKDTEVTEGTRIWVNRQDTKGKPECSPQRTLRARRRQGYWPRMYVNEREWELVQVEEGGCAVRVGRGEVRAGAKLLGGCL